MEKYKIRKMKWKRNIGKQIIGKSENKNIGNKKIEEQVGK